MATFCAALWLTFTLPLTVGQPLIDVTRLGADAAVSYEKFLNGGLDRLATYFTPGRDVVIGSDHADILRAGAGADRLRGGARADVIVGMAGNDTMQGDGGADRIFFKATGDGNNVSTDFHDANDQADDWIAISAAAQAAMVVTEDATGVLLTFSSTSSVHVDGWHAVDVGASDFLIH